MKTWRGELICGLCGPRAKPTYPVIDGKPLGVICGKCDFRMSKTIADWAAENGSRAASVERLAERIAN